MTGDIFKLFKKSIEQVNVKKTPRGTLDGGTDIYNVTVDAIVKRRTMTDEAVAESEDYNSNTTVHFRPTDAQYIELGNYMNVDGNWHSIIEIKDGKDFDKGKTKFLYCTLGNDIVTFTDDPIWGVLSA